MNSTDTIRWLRRACLPLLLAALGACGSAPVAPLLAVPRPEPGNKDIKLVRAYGEELLRVAQQQNPSSGISVVLVGRDGILWSDSAGSLGGQQALAVTADTPMHLGSITKLFTAIAIMQLQEQGKLDLDANLKTYLPEFSIHSRFGSDDFTIRQMLTHYSGLPSDLLANWFVEPSAIRAVFNQTVANTAATHLKSRPEVEHSYSNLAYQLLGIVIQRVSGENYDDYIKQHIFTPLGMQHSAVLVQDSGGAWPLPGIADDPREQGYSLISNLSAGAMVSSANDMGKFLHMLVTGGAGVLSPESFKAMLTIQDEKAMLGSNSQGLGFSLSPPGARRRGAGHSGALPGHYAFLQFLPDEQLGVVVLESANDPSNSSWMVGDNLLGVAVQSVDPAVAGSPAPTAQTPAATTSTTHLSASEAERYAGAYYGPDPGLMEIDNDEGSLTLRFAVTGLATVRLTPTGPDTFAPNLKALGFIPVPTGLVARGVDTAEVRILFDGDRRYMMLALNSPDGTQAGPLAASLQLRPVSEEWLRRTGDYTPVDASANIVNGVSITLDDKSGLLFASTGTDGGETLAFALELLSATTAATAGFGRYAGEVLEFVGDDEFVLAGAHFKGVQP